MSETTKNPASTIRVVQSDKLSEDYDSRWVVVDAATGHVLDDAQGYGYRSAANAHRAYGHKNVPNVPKATQAARRKKQRSVEKWIKANPNFMEDLEYGLLRALKEGADVTTDDVRELLKSHGLTTPFSPAELLK